jgi:hypothetical protein
MRPSNNIRNHAQHHASLILALLVLIGAVILVSGPAAFTASNSAALTYTSRNERASLSRGVRQ